MQFLNILFYSLYNFNNYYFMKKFLFTLATVFAFGATASAYTIGMALPEQIEMGATSDNRIDVNLTLTELDGICAGIQLEMVFEDPEGNEIAPGTAGTIYLNGNNWATMGDACFPNTSVSASKPGNHYRLMMVNTSYNILFMTDPYVWQDPEDPDADPEQVWDGMELPKTIATMTVRTRAAWADMEYATLRIIPAQSPVSWYDNTKVYPLEGISMKVVNKDFVTTKNIAGTVTLGDLDGNFDAPVTINMEDPTEGYVTVVTVNGTEAAIENGVVVLPDVAGEYIVAVEITADGYEGKVEASRTYTIEQAAKPTVTVEETSEYMTITATNATSLVVEGYETMTDEDGSLYVVVPRPEAATGTTVTYTATNTEEGKLPNTVSDNATATPKAKTASQAPTFRMETYDEYVLIYAEGTGTVTMTDAQGNAIDNPVRVERPAYGQPNGSYTAYATNLDNGWYTATAGNQTFEIPAKAAKVYTTKTPVVTPTVTDDAVTLTATCEDEGTVELHVTYINEDGTTNTVVYTNPAEVVIPRTDEAQYVNYWATAVANTPAGYDDVEGASSAVVYQYEIPAKPVVVLPELQGTVTVSVDAEGNVTAVYNGNEQGVTVTVNPSKLNEYGTYTVTYTATAEGYQDLTGTATVIYSAPVLERADAPETHKANYVYKDVANGVYYNAYTVTLSQPETSDDEEYVIYYRVGVGTFNETTGQWDYDYPADYTLYTGPFNVAQEGTYMVEAYAVAKDKSQSTFTYDGFTVSVAVSIEELFAGENVANVRYFNVAGQEMQEINGLTIVVTTYTDGTQSAVKVMK